MTQDRPLLTAILSGLGAALICGAWPVVTRSGVQHTLSPLDITSLRFGIAGLLLPIVVQRGADRGAIFATLLPGFTVLLAFPVLGEAPSWLEWCGAIVVMCGMLYAIGLLKTGTSEAS